MNQTFGDGWDTLDSIVTELQENRRRHSELLRLRDDEMRRLRAAGLRPKLISNHAEVTSAQERNIAAGRRRQEPSGGVARPPG